MTPPRKSSTAKAGSKSASLAKAARRGEAGTDVEASSLNRPRKRVPPRKIAENQLFAGLTEQGPADAAAQQRRLGAYARILRDAMQTAQLDEAALVRKSLLPEHVVRDALAGTAAPYGYAQYALAEPLGLDPEEVARQVATADTATRMLNDSPPVAQPMPASAAEAPKARLAAMVPDAGAPIVTRLADDKVRLTFPEPVVLPQPVADALLSLLKFRLE